MPAGIRILDPVRGCELVNTKHQTFMLSCVDYVSIDTNSNSAFNTGYNYLKPEQGFFKGCHSPLIVLPLYHVSEDRSPVIFNTGQFRELNNEYDSLQFKIYDYAPTKRTYPIFIFDIPAVGFNFLSYENVPHIKIYNPETGDITFDSRYLPLNIVRFMEEGILLDRNRIYGYADLTGGLDSVEYSTLAHVRQPPFNNTGYIIYDDKVENITAPQYIYDMGGMYKDRPIPNDGNNPYIKFYNWYRPHLLVDLTEIFNAGLVPPELKPVQFK